MRGRKGPPYKDKDSPPPALDRSNWTQTRSPPRRTLIEEDLGDGIDSERKENVLWSNTDRLAGYVPYHLIGLVVDNDLDDILGDIDYDCPDKKPV